MFPREKEVDVAGGVFSRGSAAPLTNNNRRDPVYKESHICRASCQDVAWNLECLLTYIEYLSRSVPLWGH